MSAATDLAFVLLSAEHAVLVAWIQSQLVKLFVAPGLGSQRSGHAAADVLVKLTDRVCCHVAFSEILRRPPCDRQTYICDVRQFLVYRVVRADVVVGRGREWLLLEQAIRDLWIDGVSKEGVSDRRWAREAAGAKAM